MSSFEDKNYLTHYQRLKYEESDFDPFVTCNVKRKCLAQSFHASLTLGSNDTTCALLKQDLQTYSEIVDKNDAESINNYAKSTLALVSHCRTEHQQWKSGLHLLDPSIFMKSIERSNKCLLSGQNQPCASTEVTIGDIQEMLDNLSVPIENISTLSPIKPKPAPPKSASSIQPSTSKTYCRDPTDSKPAGGNFHRPSTSGNFQGPPTGSNFQGPPAGSNFQGPPTCGNFQGPPTSGNFRGPLTGSNFQGPPAGSNFQGPPAGNKFQGPPTSGNFQGPPRETPRFAQHQVQPRNDYQLFQSSKPVWNQNASGSGSRPARPELNATNSRTSNGAGARQPIFKSAREELGVQNQKKWGSNSASSGSHNYGDPQKKSLGTRRGAFNKFVPPIRPNNEDDVSSKKRTRGDDEPEEEVDERLKNIDPKMVEMIRSEIMDNGTPVAWDDIAGLEFAKATIQEIVVWPLLRPDIFTGLRRPPKGILLFGPPGTGKTLIGKCIAAQSRSTFFSISASSLTSKWIGDGEKMVRALFAVARCHQPAVVFIDEIDSLLTQRSDTEHESSRRIKTEFLVQLDGATTGDEERILVVGATNRPQELDEAARRRLVKRLYIPLPETQARQQIIERLLSTERHTMTPDDINEVAQLTAGYSGSDVKNLCQEASLGPIRSLGFTVQIEQIQPDQVRGVNVADFKTALNRVRASVSPGDLDSYMKWDKMYGSGGAPFA